MKVPRYSFARAQQLSILDETLRRVAIGRSRCRDRNSGEVWRSEWWEVDLDSGIWTMPVDRSKTRREHKALLAPRALAMLDEARRLSHGEGLIVPSVTGKPLSDATL